LLKNRRILWRLKSENLKSIEAQRKII